MLIRRHSAAILVLALALGACQSSAPRKPATFIDSGTPLPNAMATEPTGEYAPDGASPTVAAPPQVVPGPALAGGAVAGGIADSGIIGSLGETDRQRAAQAEYYALETAEPGRAQNWANPQTGVGGTVVVGETYSINRSQCRDYTHTVTISGGEQTLRATACRQPNGTWRSVSS